jgi:hypothetical protein
MTGLELRADHAQGAQVTGTDILGEYLDMPRPQHLSNTTVQQRRQLHGYSSGRWFDAQTPAPSKTR